MLKFKFKFKFKFKMERKGADNWTEEWSEPPTSAAELDLWRVYLTLWKDTGSTPPGIFVRGWMIKHGTPSKANDPKGYFKLALEAYLFIDGKPRKASS